MSRCLLGYLCGFTSQPVYSGLNTATATWDKDLYFTPTGTASGTANVTFQVTEDVNELITVIDDKTDPAHPVNLGTWNWADGEHSFTYSLDKQGVAGTCTDYTNTAVIDETDQSDAQTVTVCVGVDLTVTKTATASKDRLYKWLIDKSVDDTLIEIAAGGLATFNYNVTVTPDGYTDSGWTLGGTITINNPNNWEDVTVNVADALDQGGTCTITEAAPYVVPASGSLVLHYSCTTDGTTTKNTATVTWNKATYFTPGDTASDDADVTFGLDVETNKVITVVDDKTDPVHPVTLGTWNWSNGPHTFEYSLTKSGVAGTCTNYTNTAVIDETDQSNSVTVRVCVGVDLTVSKTAVPTFTRTWNWAITKDYDGTYNLYAGDTVLHGYKVTVTPTPVDSAWLVVGVITLSNPNNWEAITLTSLSDVVNNGGTCTVAAGPYVVPVSGSIEVGYSCSYASAPSSYSGLNTATAAWNAGTYFTPNGTASGTRGFEFGTGSAGNPTEINPVITVNDDNLDDEVWSADRASATWEYSLPFTCSTDLGDYNDLEYSYSHLNTAMINETGASDTATVNVNCNMPYIGYTPGFWKNHTASDPSGHDAWQYTSYETDDVIGVVFDLGDAGAYRPKGKNEPISQLSLLDALSFKGGPGVQGAVEVLLRHGVAALLNASISENLDTDHDGMIDGYATYPLSTQEVIDRVNAALASGSRTQMLALASELSGWNEGGSHYVDWSWPAP